ncbi:MAG: deiodinase-like protein, partial [Planctomycetota bacterium]
VESLYVSYKDKAAFFLVYISEAHPELLKGDIEGIKGRPRDIKERAILATQCVSELKLSLPVLLDSMEGVAEKAYKGRPDRICIVDLDGRVAYYSKRGPRGFKPKEAEQALKKLLESIAEDK